MKFKYIWQRFIFKETLKVFFLFIFSFIFLFLLIDFSINGKHLLKNGFGFTEIIFYYLSQFAEVMLILIPFALLLGTIKVLIQLNKNRELLILYNGALSPRQILKPLLVIAIICTSILYINVEYFFPLSKTYLRKIEEHFFANKSIDLTDRYINIISLDDGSHFLYQYFDPDRVAFFDVFWIYEDGDKIAKIKYLYPGDPPKGTFVDLISRDNNGKLTKVLSTDEYFFKKLALDKTVIEKAKFNAKEFGIYELIKLFISNKNEELIPKILNQLALYLFFPLIPLFSVIIPIPLCIKFTRNFPIYLIFTLFIFGFLTLIMLCEGIRILGGNGVISSVTAFSILLITLTIISIKQLNSLKKL